MIFLKSNDQEMIEELREALSQDLDDFFVLDAKSHLSGEVLSKL